MTNTPRLDSRAACAARIRLSRAEALAAELADLPARLRARVPGTIELDRELRRARRELATHRRH